MSNHDEGPWTRGKFPGIGGIHAPDEVGICTLKHRDGTLMRNAEANAQLIVTAPELLAVCESLTNAWECYLSNPDAIGVDIEAELIEARAVIAKATGQEVQA